MPNYAPFYKRILSSLIDITILYACLAGIYFFYPDSFNLRVNSVALFLVSIFYHFMFYNKVNHTFGEKYLGLKLILTKKVNHKKIWILIRAIMIST